VIIVYSEVELFQSTGRLIQKNIFMLATNSYVKRSGQSWKIWLFLLLLLAGSVMLVIGFTLIGSSQPSNFVLFVLGGSCLGATGFIWLAISVICKNCRARLGWKAITEQSHDNWLLWLLNSETCPVCKNDGVTRSSDGRS
jgi:hypothetical protein